MRPGVGPPGRGRPCLLALGLNPPLGSGSMQFLQDPAKSQRLKRVLKGHVGYAWGTLAHAGKRLLEIGNV